MLRCLSNTAMAFLPFMSLASAASGQGLYNVIYGLGGADATVSGFMKIMEEISAGKAQKITYLGVKV